MQIFLLSAGPINCLYIVHGFKLQEILPIGGGRYGS